MPSPFAAGFLFPVLLPLSLAACASGTAGGGQTQAGKTQGGEAQGETSASIADGTSFRMQVGQSVVLADDSRLRYLRLANDSRCAPDVQCVWAGDAIVAFEWSPGSGAPQRFELHTGLEPRSHAVGGRKLVLESLERGEAPAATLRVEAGG
jgi:hypothetical protein